MANLLAIAKASQKFWTIFICVYFATCFPLYAIDAVHQEPKNTSGALVDFEPRMMDAPFTMKYPGNWHVREEYWGNAKAKVYFSGSSGFSVGTF